MTLQKDLENIILFLYLSNLKFTIAMMTMTDGFRAMGEYFNGYANGCSTQFL